jgi:hypothetical protein
VALPPEGVVPDGALAPPPPLPDGVVAAGVVPPLDGLAPPLDGVVAPLPLAVVFELVVDELLELVVVVVLLLDAIA